MTRKKRGKNKMRSEESSNTHEKESAKMKTDEENPQGDIKERGQTSKQGTVKSYLIYLWPPTLLDLFISTMFRIQLFLYRKVAGRMPLFLEGETSDSLESKNKKAEESCMKTLKEQTDKIKKLTEEIGSLKESNEKADEDFKKTNEEQTDKIKTLTEEIGSLKESNKKAEEDFKKTNEEQTDKIKKLTEEIGSLKESNKKADEDFKKTNEEQTHTIEKLTEEIGSLKESNKKADEDFKKTNKEQIGTIEKLTAEIGSLKESNKEMEESFMKTNKEQNEKFNEEIDRLNEVNRTWQHRFNTKENENAELSDKISTLTEEKQDLEAEKQDALRRLSELVSVRLRDNNPNIVDLNDQCRPTKLAEMFSELYDNEWTNAFDVLEGPFSEEQAIVVLLDTVMIAYGFCEGKVEKPWQILTDWFLDELCSAQAPNKNFQQREIYDLPGFQQTSKWLKDSRKANIKRKVLTVEKDFSREIATMCVDVKLTGLLSDDSVNAYFMKCIELCLLMVATDPPIVLECPHWNAYNMQQEGDEKVSESGNTEPEISTEEESKNSTVSDSNVHYTDHQIEGKMTDLQNDGNQMQERYDVEKKAQELQQSGQNGNQDSDQEEIVPLDTEFNASEQRGTTHMSDFQNELKDGTQVHRKDDTDGKNQGLRFEHAGQYVYQKSDEDVNEGMIEKDTALHQLEQGDEIQQQQDQLGKIQMQINQLYEGETESVPLQPSGQYKIHDLNKEKVVADDGATSACNYENSAKLYIQMQTDKNQITELNPASNDEDGDFKTPITDVTDDTDVHLQEQEYGNTGGEKVSDSSESNKIPIDLQQELSNVNQMEMKAPNESGEEKDSNDLQNELKDGTQVQKKDDADGKTEGLQLQHAGPYEYQKSDEEISEPILDKDTRQLEQCDETQQQEDQLDRIQVQINEPYEGEADKVPLQSSGQYEIQELNKETVIAHDEATSACNYETSAKVFIQRQTDKNQKPDVNPASNDKGDDFKTPITDIIGDTDVQLQEQEYGNTEDEKVSDGSESDKIPIDLQQQELSNANQIEMKAPDESGEEKDPNDLQNELKDGTQVQKKDDADGKTEGLQLQHAGPYEYQKSDVEINEAILDKDTRQLEQSYETQEQQDQLDRIQMQINEPQEREAKKVLLQSSGQYEIQELNKETVVADDETTSACNYENQSTKLYKQEQTDKNQKPELNPVSNDEGDDFKTSTTDAIGDSDVQLQRQELYQESDKEENESTPNVSDEIQDTYLNQYEQTHGTLEHEVNTATFLTDVNGSFTEDVQKSEEDEIQLSKIADDNDAESNSHDIDTVLMDQRDEKLIPEEKAGTNIIDDSNDCAAQREELKHMEKQEAGGDGNFDSAKYEHFVKKDEATQVEQILSKERHPFDKEVFKEYTRRGTYLDYIVWPAMFLHKNGPMLSKGIAQGIKKQYREPDEVVWTWKKN